MLDLLPLERNIISQGKDILNSNILIKMIQYYMVAI